MNYARTADAGVVPMNTACQDAGHDACIASIAARIALLTDMRATAACTCRADNDPENAHARSGAPGADVATIDRVLAADTELVVVPAARMPEDRDGVAALGRRLLDAGTAVLVVPSPVRPWRGHIGIGYDGAPGAEGAFAVARRMAHNARGQLSELNVAYVDDSASASYEVDADISDPRRGAVIEWELSELVADLPARARALRLIGDPARELADLSRDLDLLVIGTRGRAPLRRAFTGSVSRELIGTCACSMPIVPPGARKPRPQLRQTTKPPAARGDDHDQVQQCAEPGVLAPEERRILVRKQPRWGRWKIDFAEVLG